MATGVGWRVLGRWRRSFGAASTTAAMVLTGKVYGHWMVDLRATNAKLLDRSERIVMRLARVSRRAARGLLDRAGGRVKVALLMHAANLSRPAAVRRLNRCGQSLRRAIEEGP